MTRTLPRLALLSLLFAPLAGTGCGPGGTHGTGVGDDEGNGGSTGRGGSAGYGNGAGQAGMVPIDTTSCGNGQKTGVEQCDDGNVAPGDGCSPSCQVESGYDCPTPGAACVIVSACGDSMLGGVEACDDGNTMGGDGCSADCLMVDPGYQCRVPGRRCVPFCGDGLLTGTETCDPPGMGCSITCLTEPGWSCSGAPSTCVQAMCGNGNVEAGESCDEGPLNGLFRGDGSGCSKTCTTEPICRSGTGAATTRACDTSCGNGHLESGEDCDDGNLLDGDGCSAMCGIEGGFTCTTEMKPDTEPCVDSGATGECLRLPIIARDFKSENEMGGHPDFFYHGAAVANPVMITGVSGQPGAVNFNKRYCIPNTSGTSKQNDATPRVWDLAAQNLDPTGKPTFNAARTGGTMTDCQFTDWSHGDNAGHVPGYGDGMAAGRPLNGLAYFDGQDGRPRYRGPAPIVTSAETFGQWWVDGVPTGNTHSVITLELGLIAAGLYQYSSAYHSIYGGFFPLDPPENMFPLYGANGSMAGPGATRTSPTGNGEPLLCNNWPYWYSSAQFGAGNDCQAQQYILPPTASAANCFITDANDMSWLAGCWAGTTARDQVVQGWFHNQWFTTEARYLFAFNGPFSLQFFGDDDLFIFINGVLVVDLGGVHQRLPGRVDVSAEGVASIVEGGSLDPTTNQINPCPGMDPFTMQPTVAGVDCRARSADLGLEAGRTYEIAIFHADRGATESNYQLTLSGFSTARSVCVPRCGDGIRTGGEECDCGDAGAPAPAECAGVNNMDGVYGGCTSMCRFGPFCGDMVVDASGGEECDLGRMNISSYGEDGCTPGCRVPPRCGDGIVQAAYREECDAGSANSPTGACLPDCTLPVR